MVCVCVCARARVCVFTRAPCVFIANLKVAMSYKPPASLSVCATVCVVMVERCAPCSRR